MFDFEKSASVEKTPGMMNLDDYRVGDMFDAIPLAKALGWAFPEKAIEMHCRDFIMKDGSILVNKNDYVRLALGMRPWASEARMI